jgi:hypothetical protein
MVKDSFTTEHHLGLEKAAAFYWTKGLCSFGGFIPMAVSSFLSAWVGV